MNRRRNATRIKYIYRVNISLFPFERRRGVAAGRRPIIICVPCKMQTKYPHAAFTVDGTSSALFMVFLCKYFTVDFICRRVEFWTCRKFKFSIEMRVVYLKKYSFCEIILLQQFSLYQFNLCQVLKNLMLK